MKTNKLIPLILTAALALSACASAADSATAAAAAETPESTAESAIEPGTEAVETDTLYGLNYSYSQSVVYEDLPTLDDEWNFAGTNVYKNDLNAGQTTLIYHCDDWCLADPYVTSDAVYLLTYNRDRDNKIIALSPDGTKTHEIPFDPYASTVVLYSDRYFYCMDGHAPYDTASGFRLDLQTGETAPWNLPVETISVANAAGDFAVTERIVSDYPVPFPRDGEISDALLQNSLREYDLTDIATDRQARPENHRISV